MKEYSYVGVASSVGVGLGGVKFLVRSKEHSIHKGSIVKFTVDNRATVYADVLHASYLPIGSEEEAMLAEFGDVYEVEKIYGLDWEKKEEEEKNA